MAEEMRQVPEVRAAAVPTKHEKYPWPEKPTLIGTEVKRLDGPIKATGRARYSYDIKRPGYYGARSQRSREGTGRQGGAAAAQGRRQGGLSG